MDRGIRWGAIAAMVVMMALVAALAYNFGVAQGFVESGRIATAPGAAAPIVYEYPRHWHWGWGFGFGPFLGLFWVFLMFALVRRLFWGPRWYRRCGYYGYDDRVPPDFDEWHRRAHNQQEPTTL
ncbi:MAG TPA: hypothetical protein VKH42_14685 [Vicinamibacterales bacterium]|nr:hypothetical protein [Vicinamibacterales bacterium]